MTLGKAILSGLWTGWLMVSVYLMSTALQSDIPTWLRFTCNGIIAAGIWWCAHRRLTE